MVTNCTFLHKKTPAASFIASSKKVSSTWPKHQHPTSFSFDINTFLFQGIVTITTI